MKTYKYSLWKVFVNYWLIFLLPFLAIYAVIKIGLDKFSWITILPIFLTFLFLAIPLVMVFILLKTEIQISESEITRKRFKCRKSILWKDVISIEKKNMYTIFPDKPRAFLIRDKDNIKINVYGFLKDIEGIENDIMKYSKKEIKN